MTCEMKQEQQAGTEHVREPRAAGNRLVECLVQQPADAGAPIEPVAQATHQASTSRVGTSWRSILISNLQPAALDPRVEFVHPRGGGPDSSVPSVRECAVMAGAHELPFRVVPGDRASKVRAHCGQHARPAVGRLDDDTGFCESTLRHPSRCSMASCTFTGADRDVKSVAAPASDQSTSLVVRHSGSRLNRASGIASSTPTAECRGRGVRPETSDASPRYFLRLER